MPTPPAPEGVVPAAAAADPPLEDRTYSAAEVQTIKDEAIARRHDLKPFKEAFQGYGDEERDAVLGMITQLRDSPAEGVTRMRDIAHNMSTEIPDYDFLDDAPWLKPEPTPAADVNTTVTPNLTHEQVEDMIQKEGEKFLNASRAREISDRIDRTAESLGYTKYAEGANGAVVTPGWDILITVAARPEYANMNSPEDTIAAAHKWLQENGPGSQAPITQPTEHPRTVGVPPAGTPVPGEQAQVISTMAQAHEAAARRAGLRD